MQEATLPKWAKPKKAASSKDQPLVIRAKDSPPPPPEEAEEAEAAPPALADSPTLPAEKEVFTAIGIRPCRNSRFVMADLNGKKITIRVLKGRKNPARQPIKCRHVELDSYEEIR
jgi:hypothetical protein